ncbi:MAG: helix-turn-helix transcriptional regulator [Clostridia bacterium]|nr:helix-turn-helix transcriptional regulator [Clostridia bacterium]
MRLRALREDHDLTQAALAAYLHIRQNTYSQYENGQRQIPIGMLAALAVYYDTSVDYLIELTDEASPYPRTIRRED